LFGATLALAMRLIASGRPRRVQPHLSIGKQSFRLSLSPQWRNVDGQVAAHQVVRRIGLGDPILELT
jgi:hypothetical protein